MLGCWRATEEPVPKATAQQQHQDSSIDLPQVLDLVISSTSDALLLCKATAVSSWYMLVALTSIRQNLPQLLVHTIKQAAHAEYPAVQHAKAGWPVAKACQGGSRDLLPHLRWLCAAAGREAVSQPQVAAALLSADMVTPAVQPGGGHRAGCWMWSACACELAQAGLKLTDGLVASVARQQLPSVRFLLNAIRKAACSIDRHGGLSELCASVVLNREVMDTKLAQHLGPQLDATAVTDLLYIACNEGADTALAALCTHDACNTKLLSSIATDEAMAVDFSSRPSAAFLQQQQLQQQQTMQQLSQQQQEQQQQRQLRQSALLYEQLLLTCLVAGHVGPLVELLKLKSAASNLSAASVGKLMQAAALLGNPRPSLGHGFRTALDILSELLAAKDVNADTIASTLRMLLHAASLHSRYSMPFSRFQKLPGALSLSSSQVCNLLLLAVRKQLYDVLPPLARLARECDLQRDDVMQLMLTVCNELGTGPFVDVLGFIYQMKFSRYITAEDTLALLTKVATGCSQYDESELLKSAMDLLDYKSIKITGQATYRCFLEAVVKGAGEEFLDDIMHHITAPEIGPVLSLQEYLKLLRSCVVHRLLPGAVTAMPAAQQVSAADLYDLLQLCFVGRPRLTPDPGETDSYDNGPCPLLIQAMATLPAMQQLSAEQVVWVLQHALQERAGVGVREMLVLPASRCISAEAARELVLTAFQHGQLQRLKEICDGLPACAAAWEGLDPQLLEQQLQTALTQQSLSDAGVICSLLQHPKLQQHAGEVLPAVLLAGFRCFQKVKKLPGFSLLMFSHGFAGSKADKPAAPGKGGIELSMPLDQLAALLHLPAAKQLSALVVQELMRLSIVRMGGDLLQQLANLPAAAQVSDADVLGLLRLAIKRDAAAAAGTDGPLTSAAGGGAAAQASKQQPAASEQGAAVSSTGAAELVAAVQACLSQPSGTAVLFPLLHLPWAQHLPAAVIRCLLQAAAERQARSTFDRLMQLTHAPRDDAEVQGYADIIRFCSGPAALKDAKEGRWDLEERDTPVIRGDSDRYDSEMAESSGSNALSGSDDGEEPPAPPERAYQVHNAVCTGCMWPPPDYRREWSD